jgi:membrane protease YdiL (CAAX protease family)
MQERYQYLFKIWNVVVALAFGLMHAILLTSVTFSNSATHFVLEFIFCFLFLKSKHMMAA